MAYKAMNKDMKCQGFQFEVGKEYSIKGGIELCRKGFHACENPFDVWDYYPITDGTRFFEVEQSGNKESSRDKTVCSKIKIKAELSLKEFIRVGIEYVSKKTKNKKSGDCAKLAASGHYAKLAASGHYAKLAASGDYAKSEVSGKESIACSIGVRGLSKADKDGWIVIVDWQCQDSGWIIKNIHSAKVGRKIKGIKIKPNVFYWFENGELREEK